MTASVPQSPNPETLRREMDALRAERDEALATRTALEADLARATEQASTARTRASRAVIRAEARAMAARMGAVEPADVVRLVDLSAVTLTEDGTPQGLDTIMEAARESRAYLFTPPRPASGADTGTTASGPAPRAGDPVAFDARTAGARDVKAAASAAGLRWPVAT
ncbi:phage scaffolding protein [Komagataeibacter sp. FNDCF1]|uniref:phage scaffolding protein n=1 Tax=Komagataeibacter sp. FNDCF1 TaxID=2878681 RepID=UPI001E4DA37F|nr:phage scaffolding protein [Komagataeibacter sp. FNDCF1]MCE2563651.1 phage scaffolding protein [Komagataeibacter sp. FNDCF1]